MDVPFKFRGRAVGLTFHEQPSKMVPRSGFLEKQPRLKVIDDLNDDEPVLRPNEEYNFNYWEVSRTALAPRPSERTIVTSLDGEVGLS